jgi:Predicted glycosyltransferases
MMRRGQPYTVIHVLPKCVMQLRYNDVFLSPFNPPAMSLSVSVIIVNYNSWHVLTKLLQSLLKQDIDTDLIQQLDVIVVDNNSSQAMPDFNLIEKHLKQQDITIQWIKSPHNLGFAGGCNQGVAQAAGDLVLFCNPDIEIPEQGLNALINVYQNHHVDLLAPVQIGSRGQNQKIDGKFPTLSRYVPLLGGFFKQSHHSSADDFYHCDWISGAVILMKKSDFKRLGGWDDSFFMFMEDVDLCFRASQIGLTVGVTGKTIWLHHHGVSSKQRMVDRVRSKSAALAAKHIYVKKHFIGWRKYMAQALISLKYLPELLLGWLLSWPIPKPIFVSRRLILHRHLSDFKNGFKKSP